MELLKHVAEDHFRKKLFRMTKKKLVRIMQKKMFKIMKETKILKRTNPLCFQSASLTMVPMTGGRDH